MKNVLVPLGVIATVLLLMASPASAQTVCNNTEATPLTGPQGGISVGSGVCYLDGATVAGNITVGAGGFLSAKNTTVAGSVTATGAQTVFIDEKSLVGGNIVTSGADQVFLFNSTVGGSISVKRTQSVANVCGMTVRNDIEVKDGFRDVLVGSNDPGTDCAGNLVLRGDIEVKRNNTDKELVVQSNTILDGDLEVSGNIGPSDKAVQDNTGMPNESIVCSGNSEPFVGSPNSGFGIDAGQCESTAALPPVGNFTCNGTFVGIVVNNVTVPPDGSCTLSDSTVAGRVNVRSRAYFEANTKTIIAGSVTGTVGGKQFIFLDQGTIVGGDIYTTGADQIWLFNSTALRAVNLVGTKSVVNICGMTIRDEVNVQDGFRDVLVGSNDPTTDCAGNLILREDVEIKDNDVDKEVTVQSNRLLDGDLEVVGNTGDGPKVVQDNVGTPDEALVCFGNSDPFTGTPNAGFGTATGQCSGI